MVAKKEKLEKIDKETNNFQLTTVSIVTLVALVALVSVVALVMNAGIVRSSATPVAADPQSGTTASVEGLAAGVPLPPNALGGKNLGGMATGGWSCPSATCCFYTNPAGDTHTCRGAGTKASPVRCCTNCGDTQNMPCKNS